MPIKFTETERKLLKVLSDGKPHTVSELLPELWDAPHGRVNDIRAHMRNIRAKLEQTGHTIVCITNGVKRPVKYQHVRLLADPEDRRMHSKELTINDVVPNNDDESEVPNGEDE